MGIYPVLADVGATVLAKLSGHSVLLLENPRLPLGIAKTVDRYLDRTS